MNEKKSFFWTFFVFFVFVYYFDKLEKESKKVIYTSYFKDLRENPSILFCVSLNAHCDNKTIKYGDFKRSKLKNETMKNLVCHLSQNIPKNPKLIIKEAEKWNFLDAFQSRLNNTIKKDILMFDYHLCANLNLILNLTVSKKYFRFFFNNINTKVFIYPAKNLNFFSGVSFFTFNFDKNDKKISHIIIKQIKIINSNYEKVCSNNKHQMNLNFCSKIYCNQQCYKKKINDHRFLYMKKDDLILKENNSTSNPIDHECFNNCFKNFHGYHYYIHKTIFSKKITKNVDFIFNSKAAIIATKRLIPRKIFILKVTALLSVLLGFSYLNFLLNCLSDFGKLLKINKSMLIKKIQIFIFFFTIANSLIECSSLLRTYKKYFFINTSTSLYPVDYSPLSISPCFDVRKIINKNNFNREQKLYKPIEKNNIFTLQTFTLKLKNLLNESSILFVTNYKKLKIDTFENQVFYVSDKSSKQNNFRIFKCFLININVKQNLIKKLLGGVNIILKFNKPVSFYYITEKKSYPNSYTKQLYFKPRYRIIELTTERDETFFDCKIYKEDCFSQKGCVDKCIVFNYFKKNHKLPLKIPILLNWYNAKQLKSFCFSLNQTEKLQNNLKYFCIKSFPSLDCTQKLFDSFKIIKVVSKNENVSKLSQKKDEQYFSIFSYSFSVKNSKILFMNKNELFSNILTSINVWLGLSIPKITKKFSFELFQKIFSLFKFHLIINSTSKKALKALFSIILAFCLLYNLYILKNETLRQSKVTSVEYKFLTEIEYPIITICLNLKNKVNFSEKINFTGNLLDKMTFSASDVFESVNYFDQNLNKKIQTDLSLLDSNKINNFLELTHFYFMKLKCFKFKYKTKIPFYYFYKNQNDSSFFTISLKPNITEYYFTLGTKRTLNFNHFRKLKKKKHYISFFSTAVENKDSYAFLRDFTYFFKKQSTVNFNEAKSYSDFLKKKFKESSNLTTLLLPLDKKYFHLTIDNKEFFNFYRNKIFKLEKEIIDNSYSANHFLKSFTNLEQKNENKIKLRPNLIATVTKIKDKIPLEYFILFVLNIVSFWFNFSLINIFDQINIVFKLFQQLFFFLNNLVFKIMGTFFSIIKFFLDVN